MAQCYLHLWWYFCNHFHDCHSVCAKAFNGTYQSWYLLAQNTPTSGTELSPCPPQMDQAINNHPHHRHSHSNRHQETTIILIKMCIHQKAYTFAFRFWLLLLSCQQNQVPKLCKKNKNRENFLRQPCSRSEWPNLCVGLWRLLSWWEAGQKICQKYGIRLRQTIHQASTNLILVNK